MRIFLIALVIMLLVPVAAHADLLTYLGEDGTTGSEIDAYGGPNGDDGLWDYVYQITASGPPFTITGIWGVACPVAPVAHWERAAAWTYRYFSAADGGIPNFVPLGIGLNQAAWNKLSDLWIQSGTPGIVWYATNGDFPSISGDAFHFQSTASPTTQRYDGDGWNNETTTSASPEPGSILLLCMMVGAGGLWRRRRVSATRA